MRHIVYLLAGLCSFPAAAQLPYFSTQAGQSTYSDNNNRTEKYRELEHFEREIVPRRAHQAAARCLRRIDTLLVLQQTLEIHGRLSPKQAAALDELLREATFGNHELLGKLSESANGETPEVSVAHHPALESDSKENLAIRNLNSYLLNEEESLRFLVTSQASAEQYASSETVSSARLVNFSPASTRRSATVSSPDFSPSETSFNESELAQLVAAIDNFRNLNRSAAAYFLGVHTYLGSTDQKQLMPVRNLRESAFFFHGRNSADVLTSASFQLTDAARPMADVEVISLPLPFCNLTVSSTALSERDTSARQKVVDKLVFGTLGTARLEVPLFYRAGRTTKFYLPVIGRISADRMQGKEFDGQDELFAFGAGAFATLDITVDNPISDQRAGFYVQVGYELLRTNPAGANYLAPKDDLDRTGYHVAQVKCGFRGQSGMTIGFNAPIVITDRTRYLASNPWTIGVKVEPRGL